MNLHLSIGPLVSLIAGILILMVPRLLNYIVAIYLIVIGAAWSVRNGHAARIEVKSARQRG
jgi:hypothetical protein